MAESRRDFDELLKKLAAPTESSTDVHSLSDRAGRRDQRGSFSPGQILLERYRVTRLIAVGGMGEIYEAEDSVRGDRVALKCLGAHLESDKALRRFALECDALERTGHPNIVRVFDTGLLEDSRPYFSMELVEGRSLQAELDENGRIPVERMLGITRALCSALDAAHERGIVHRDVKPENVLVSEGRHDSVKLADFGIAKLLSEDTLGLTSEGVTLGTPSFMAPEQVRGDQDLDQRADIYALGVSLYVCLTGKLPFVGKSFAEIGLRICSETPPTVRELCPEISPVLSALVGIAMDREPSRRFPSCRALASALDSVHL